MSTVNVPQAAALLQVHPKTVLELINTGALAAGQVGRAYVMLTKDVLQYLETTIIRQTAERMRRRK